MAYTSRILVNSWINTFLPLIRSGSNKPILRGRVRKPLSSIGENWTLSIMKIWRICVSNRESHSANRDFFGLCSMQYQDIPYCHGLGTTKPNQPFPTKAVSKKTSVSVPFNKGAQACQKVLKHPYTPSRLLTSTLFHFLTTWMVEGF
jgi:hypothetical protein